MASSSSPMSMKLVIETKREIVLYAEASKPVIDFISNLLCLPFGDVVRLLPKKEMVGCLGNLCESVEKLNKKDMKPNQNNDVLLKPIAADLLPTNDGTVAADKSKSVLEEEISIDKNGFVKEEATYMVMDDLAVKPLSSTSIFTLLKKSKVKDVAALDERVVQFGRDEGINLLKASLQSKTVLTSVFLMKKVETK